MREFFKGWRRKTGCVLLVVACLFACCWIRSTLIGDGIVVQFPGETYVVSSQNQIFGWIWHTGNFPTSAQFTHCCWPVGKHYPAKVVHPFIYAEIEWRRRCQRGDFEFGAGHIAGIPLTTWAIPYWCVAIPTTLLSAYLILWKPRNAK